MDELHFVEMDLCNSYQYSLDYLQKYQTAVQREKAALEEQLAVQEAVAKKLPAFVNIAKAHTTNFLKPTTPKPFDNHRLSQLAVQINSSSNDPAAAQLYTEAMAQMMGVEQQIWKIRTESEAKIKNIQHDTRISVTRWLEFFHNAMLRYDMKFRDGCIDQSITSLSLGCWKKFFPHSAPEMRAVLDPVFPADDYFLREKDVISVPQEIRPHDGQLVIAEYTDATEAEVLGGIQRLLINAALYHADSHIPLYDQVTFIDPIRLSASGLGPIAGMCGKDRFIDPVPASAEEIRKKVGEIVAVLGRQTANSRTGLYIFHNFPEAYDSLTTSQIRQLAIDAKRLGVIILLTSHKSIRPSDMLESLKPSALVLPAPGEPGANGERFSWYEPPESLTDMPHPELLTVERAPAVVQISNDYNQLVGFKPPQYRKGIRRIENIPYGVDDEGELLTMSFEDNNFATFICGASRSGKSTLYHALISGFLKNCHPDDVEIWLIDFKMTEFSRYMDPIPPHVRYIILDESPELVYDIVDRLTEILQKRQNQFMSNRWEKLSDVPASAYMPALMVVIDEFSVMSQIIADSALSGKENYVVKMQLLLAKGAALGMHFIFASQGFTTGTRGLNDFAKKQVQQRVAMKTDINEIRATLELKTTSGEDQTAMEHLVPHYALTRIPEGENGNHVQLAHVLYLSDTKAQARMIREIREGVNSVPVFDPADPSAYIHKEPLIINGQTYQTFREKTGEMTDSLSSVDEDDSFTLFIGEPRRMRSIYPISVTDEFCENLLIFAPLDEKMPAASVVLSIAQSLELQDRDVELWTSGRSQVYRQLKNGCRAPFALSAQVGLDEVCQRIQALKKQIEKRREGNGFFILLGFESLLTDMDFISESSAPSTGSKFSFRIDRPVPTGPDLLTQLEAAENSAPAESGPVQAPEPAGGSAPVADLSYKSFSSFAAFSAAMNAAHEVPAAPKPPTVPEPEAYDARSDLTYILTNGPRLGYHFLMLFPTVGDVSQNRLDMTLFRHKIFFRMSRADALKVVGSSEASSAAVLESPIFRYTNGIDGLSFRPYLHPGLSWIGWQIGSDGKAAFVEEKQSYLQ